VLSDALAVYRNESCIAQFLSQRLILEMKLLPCADDAASRMVELTEIHAAAGLLRIRQTPGPPLRRAPGPATGNRRGAAVGQVPPQRGTSLP
jgi:hypothetical protein